MAAVVSSALAAPSHAPSTILGNGAYSCGTWTADRRDGGEVWDTDRSWLAGYLSGYSVFGGSITNVIEGLDRDARAQWVDNYCDAHPLDPIYTAADALIAELRRRGGR